MLNHSLRLTGSVAARALSRPIVAYRRWVSPTLPARCRFHPTCSAYALEAVRVHGAVRGGWLSLKRLGRCQPFHPGGYDPVPAAHRNESTQMTETGGSS